MASGLYLNTETIERYASTATSGWTFAPNKYVTPIDIEVQGMYLLFTGATASTGSVTANVSVIPTSQVAATGGAVVGTSNGVLNNVGQTGTTYNLWTSTNVPTIVGTAATPAGNGLNNITITDTSAIRAGYGYSLNYPLPGAPDGSTSGFITAQQLTKGTNAGASTTAPNAVILGAPVLKAPDNVYFGINDLTTYGGTGYATTPANLIHAGDVISITTSGTASTTTPFEIIIFANKA